LKVFQFRSKHMGIRDVRRHQSDPSKVQMAGHFNGKLGGGKF
jgi:hypothetical protein